jgi:hypothetical protein
MATNQLFSACSEPVQKVFSSGTGDIVPDKVLRKILPTDDLHQQFDAN